MTFIQRQAWGAAAAEQYVEQWKKEAEEWDRKVKMNEKHLKKLEFAKEPYIDGKLIVAVSYAVSSYLNSYCSSFFFFS